VVVVLVVVVVVVGVVVVLLIPVLPLTRRPRNRVEVLVIFLVLPTAILLLPGCVNFTFIFSL